jgi:hypothetical protein
MSSTRRFLLAAAITAASASVASATVIADYQFHHNYTSTVPGAPDLVPLNTVSFTTAVVDGQTVDAAAFDQGSGFRMDAPANISTGGYTVVLLFSFQTTSGYRKMIDFHDREADAGLYNLNGLLDFYPSAAGTGVTIVADTFVQVVLTRNAAGEVDGYVDGVPQFAFGDSQQYTVLATNSFNLLIDDFATGEHEASAGTIVRVRLYDAALTASQVAALDRVGSGSCRADINGDGQVNLQDFLAFLQAYAAGLPVADFNGDGQVNIQDFLAFLSAFAAGCG